MSIANRLYLGFALIILLLIVTTSVGRFQVNEINKTLTRLKRFRVV